MNSPKEPSPAEELAGTMSKKIIEAIEGFPCSSAEQRAAIAASVGSDLSDYVNEKLDSER